MLPRGRAARRRSRSPAPSSTTSSAAPIDIDLDALDEAARRIAHAENVAVFHGWAEAGIRGIAEACTHPAVALSDDFNAYARHTAEAVETLLRGGIGGPYALALGPDQYTGVIQTTEHGGYPLFDHLKKILAGGPIVWAPGVRGAVVVSLRGGDFLFESGQDLSIGYDHHDADSRPPLPRGELQLPRRHAGGGLLPAAVRIATHSASVWPRSAAAASQR